MVIFFFPVFNKNGRKLFVHVTYNEQLHLTNITITLEYKLQVILQTVFHLVI